MTTIAFGLTMAFWMAQVPAAQSPPVTPKVGAPKVGVEEEVYTIVSPDNGSGPLWSAGCTSIARFGDDVLVSQMETGKDVPPLCNTRWILRHRTAQGWDVLAQADGYRQREPTSLAVLSNGTFYLYVNDSTQPPGTKYGPCDPHLLAFSLAENGPRGQRLSMTWQGQPTFTDHSYRGYAADSDRNWLMALNIDAQTSVQNWCLLDASGATLRNGQITFPIRACYPQVAVKNGAAYVLAIGDIVEPVEAWRAYKFEQSKREWDYVFRILYFTYSPDILKQDFAPPIEIANVDATAGYIRNQDLWISPQGEAYILYSQQEVQSAQMRDKFFPGQSVLASLRLAIVKDGQVVARRILLPESEAQPPGEARFHETPDGCLYALVFRGGAQAGNSLIPILPANEGAPLIPIPFKAPFHAFTLANVRAGCKPSFTIDVLGHSTSNSALSYGQVVLQK